MKHFPYMPLYWNDFLSDNKVRVQSIHELGAYVRLLGAAWHEDIPGTLPADDDVLARLAGVELSLWGKLSPRILPCFTLNEQTGRYEQKRMMAEHAKVVAQMEMKQDRATLGASKRWEGHVKKSPSNAKAMPKHRGSNANQKQKQTQSQGISGEDKSSPSLTDPFDRFWLAYPRKEGKAEARKSFEKVGAEQFIDAILAAVERQKTGTQWTKDGGEFIPQPKTWLNQKRWEDEGLFVLPQKKRHYDN